MTASAWKDIRVIKNSNKHDVLHSKYIFCSSHPANVPVLRLCDLYLTSLRSVDSSHGQLEEEVFTEIYTVLQNNLSSPHHQVR